MFLHSCGWILDIRIGLDDTNNSKFSQLNVKWASSIRTVLSAYYYLGLVIYIINALNWISSTLDPEEYMSPLCSYDRVSTLLVI